MQTEEQLNAIAANEKLPANVRYAMLRQVICENAKNREDKHTLLNAVGHQLGGELVKGKPDYWLFKDGRKAKFDLVESSKPASAMKLAFRKAFSQ